MKNQIIFLASVAIALTLSAGCEKDENNLPTAGLVAYYSFDNNAQDESGNGNNGSVNNGVQFVKNRKMENSKAVYFDGIDDYILISHKSYLNFERNDNFAISLWVQFGSEQMRTSDPDNDILSKWVFDDNLDETKGYPFVIRIGNQTDTSGGAGKWHGARYDGLSDGCDKSAGVQSLNRADDNEWHHLVFMSKDGEVICYTDGSNKVNKPNVTTCDTRNNAPLLIGIRHRDGRLKNNAFKGAVDDLRIYNRALSEEEIQQLYKE